MSNGASAYPSQRPLLGTIVILLSAVLFASATAGVKIATLHGEASAVHVTMARFLLGTIGTLPAVIRDPAIVRPREPRWVWLRAISNVIAVFLFFYGIQLTTVSKANLLNMTYPVFVFLFAPFVTREKIRPLLVLFLLLTLAGVWNVVRPDNLHSWSSLAVGDVLAFGSALVAGFAISTLRRARQYDSGGTVLFHMMVVGLVANAALLPFFPLPAPRVLGIVGAAGAAGALGQVMLTVGFRHISASSGALLSTARIPIAGAIGVFLFADPVTIRTVLGAALILCSLVGVTLHSAIRGDRPGASRPVHPPLPSHPPGKRP